MQVLAVLPEEDVQEREWNNPVLVFPMGVCVCHWSEEDCVGREEGVRTRSAKHKDREVKRSRQEDKEIGTQAGG